MPNLIKNTQYTLYKIFVQVCASMFFEKEKRKQFRLKKLIDFDFAKKSHYKILITTLYSDGYHGGVIYTAELGNYLSSLGHNVSCASMAIDESIVDLYKQNHISLYHIDDLPLEEEYDIIWAHNFPILPYLISKNIKFKKILYSSLSSFLEIDIPPIFYKDLNLLLVYSEENKKTLVDKFSIPSNNITILNNLVPDSYFSHILPPKNTLKKIAIVSNHVPSEIEEAKSLLEEKGFGVTIFGVNHTYKPISPEILSEFDVIISIGKTVLYSLAMGIPCYCYDKFGGIGYIRLSNINSEEACNFSGRSTKIKKTPETIALEIINNFPESAAESIQLKNTSLQRYKLSTRINSIIEKIRYSPNTYITYNQNTKLFIEYCKYICKHLKTKPTFKK